MKWSLAITMTAILAGCVASSSATSQLAISSNKTVESLETQTLVFSAKELQRQDKLKNNKKKIALVVKKLLNRVGKTRYVFSGSTPYGWDCSGMVMWAYGQMGKELPHSATKQSYAGRRVAQKDRKVGDIVIFG
jgi:cell wall-associated NlpC family hydrolase